ncbi:MAG: class flavin-dependent oxidoreductase [Thermomicrobiales bacterium]|nr:class flavin-dependent oxidoreductase [Thermomicrobiales bacterium]
MATMLPIGLELPGEPSVPEMMATASLAEQLGYESIWLTETRFTRDAITTTSAVATATRTARIATAVINPFTRGAVLMAVTAATLDEVCGGRFVLGIGPGSPTVLERQGIHFDRPLGETMQVAGAQLDFSPKRSTIPIYLGVTGPKALALAGEIADGVILNGFVSVEYTKRAVEIVRSSARASGRDPNDVEITGSIVVSIDANKKIALDAARPLVALYLAEFPNVARESGIPPSLLNHIAAVHRREGSQAAAELVADAVVTDLTCAGTISEVQEALARRRGATVDLPIASLAQSSMIPWLGQLVQ